MLRIWVARMIVLVLSISVVVMSDPGVGGASEPPPTPLTAWGQRGQDPGEFSWLEWVAVAPDGDVYTSELWGQRVQHFSADGELLGWWGTFGEDPGEFTAPEGIAIDADGYVYVVDSYRIQKYTAGGTFVTEWGDWGQVGGGLFQSPTGIAVDDGFVYVVDAGNNRIQKFTSDGVFVTAWGNPNPLPGSGNGRFDSPEGIAVHEGTVYVADSFNHRIQRFSTTGTFLGAWGTNGTGPGQFQGPKGVGVDGDGDVYVSDVGNDRVQKFTATGTFVSAWGRQGPALGEFEDPWGVALDQTTGDLYVAELNNDRVQAFGYRGRPDAQIKKGATGLVVGKDVYNTTGVGQTRWGAARRGGSVTYFVNLQNDAAFPEALRLRGTASTTRFRVRYFDSTGTDITRGVKTGTFATPTLAPGAKFKVKVVVTVRSSAPAGARLAGSLKATSSTHPTFKDKVVFVTRRI
ncbi:MAG: hypothetical protein KDB35_15640 [Acidimicrobiales bacterium]|nr:hypothetical protein [Acidimicrobiales bacterium]